MATPKARAELAGRALIAYPLDALQTVCGRVVVVAKRDTQLPALAVERWNEPDEPRDPLAGIRHALAHAPGAILVCAADMPFVTPDVLWRIAAGLRPPMKAAVASSEAGFEPLLAAYAREALEPLSHAPPDAPLRRHGRVSTRS